MAARFTVRSVTPSLRLVLLLLLAVLLPLRSGWAWSPEAVPVAPASPCALHAAMSGVDEAIGQGRDDAGTHAVSTLCHASAGACCVAVLPPGGVGVPGSQPIASVRYPRLTVPAPAFHGTPDERPPKLV